MKKIDTESSEGHSIKAAGHSMGKPAYPTGEEAVGLRKGLLDPEIASACLRKTRAKFCVGHGRQPCNQTVQGKHKNQSRTCHTGSKPGQDENTGSDHGPDPDHGHMHQPHVAGQLRDGFANSLLFDEAGFWFFRHIDFSHAVHPNYNIRRCKNCQ